MGSFKSSLSIWTYINKYIEHDYSLAKPWTSLYMDGTAVNFFLVICPHEAGIWDPNYTPGMDFLDHDFL